MVDIYLNFHGSQVHFLCIPNSDVERLSIHPFKWLRYVLFCICGARGDLSAMPDGPPVDYRSTSVADIIYYYNPSENCIFVDYEGLDDHITSTSLTDRRYKFREDVIRRDGPGCVITRDYAEQCDAVHLIPWSKGDEYIERVVRDRSLLYPSPPSISGIDDIQNGVLLTKTLHSLLGCGRAAFLKTPNYGLEPTDIRRVDLGHAHTHITLQQLKKPNGDNPDILATLTNLGMLYPATAFFLGAHVDALFQGTGSPLPPAIILDYLYGVAAYDCWRSRQSDDEVHGVMKSYRQEHYADIPPRRPPSNDDDDGPPTSLQRRCYTSLRRGDVMVKAMDKLNSRLMLIQGITPQEAANRRDKRMEEEELRAQEASRSKVTEWMKTTAASGS